MFEKNDRLLTKSSAFFNLCFGILIGLSVTFGIILCVANAIVAGLIMIIVYPLMIVPLWILTYLMLNFFCDIKIIRNKLYGKDNSSLQTFIESADLSSASETYTYFTPETTETLRRLKKLADEGIISPEEFEQEKKKLLNL